MTAFDRASRLYYIDYIRIMNMMIVILVHTAVAYITFTPYRWVVADSQGSLLCDFIVLVCEYFAMPLLFFLSGYLMPPSLAKQGPAQYARSRLQRLGIPFLVGLSVMCPVMTYVRALAKGKNPGPYVSYWLTTYFHGKIYVGYLWFLSTLLFFLLLACLAWRLSPGLKAWLRNTPAPSDADRFFSPARLLCISAGIGLCMFAVNLFLPDAYWVHWGQKGIIIFQPTRLPLYAGFFILGLLACRWKWRFIHELEARQSATLWSVGAGLCLCAYIGLLFNFSESAKSPALLRLSYCLLRSVGPLCLLVLIIDFFKTRLGSPSAWKNLLAANAYGVYVAHIPFVVTLQYLLLPAELAPQLKFAIVVSLSLPLSFLTSHFVLRRLPVIGKYF